MIWKSEHPTHLELLCIPVQNIYIEKQKKYPENSFWGKIGNQHWKERYLMTTNSLN